MFQRKAACKQTVARLLFYNKNNITPSLSYVMQEFSHLHVERIQQIFDVLREDIDHLKNLL